MTCDPKSDVCEPLVAMAVEEERCQFAVEIYLKYGTK